MLFRRLAVFVGGCTLAAAEAVCATPEGVKPLGLDVLDGLSALVEQSLVQQREEGEDGEPRFSMLHVIREYAFEQLEASGEAEALRRAHATYYLALGEKAAPELRGPRLRLWLDRLEREHDNLRAALALARESGDAEMGLRLAVALYDFWHVRGYWSEAGPWLEAMLAMDTARPAGADAVNDAGDSGTLAVLRAEAMVCTGLMAFFPAVDEVSQSHVENLLTNGLAAAREVGDLRTAVRALVGLAVKERELGAMARAMSLYDEALAIAHQSQDDDALLEVLGNFGYLDIIMQQPDAGDSGEHVADEALGLAQRLGRPAAEVDILQSLGRAALRRGHLARAEALQMEALRCGWTFGITYRVPVSIIELAAVASKTGECQRAARLMGTAMALFPRLTGILTEMQRAWFYSRVKPARSALGEEAWAAAFAAGRAMTLEEAIAEALGETG